MPQYNLGPGGLVRRKNLYMPCIIGPQFEEATSEEQATILKETWWADLIASSEWRALLEEAGCSPSAKSRLKKKAAGWLMALARIAVLQPALYSQIVDLAQRTYREQIGEAHPLFSSDESRVPPEREAI